MGIWAFLRHAVLTSRRAKYYTDAILASGTNSLSVYFPIMHCKLTPLMLFELAEMMDIKIKASIMSQCSPKLDAVPKV